MMLSNLCCSLLAISSECIYIQTIPNARMHINTANPPVVFVSGSCFIICVFFNQKNPHLFQCGTLEKIIWFNKIYNAIPRILSKVYDMLLLDCLGVLIRFHYNLLRYIPVYHSTFHRTNSYCVLTMNLLNNYTHLIGH